MSVHIVFGKPGSGKSLGGTYQIIEDLLETDKTLGTNFPLNVDRLNEYLQQKHPDRRDINLLDRLFIIPDDWLRNFYDYRSPGMIQSIGQKPVEPEYSDDRSIARTQREKFKQETAAWFEKRNRVHAEYADADPGCIYHLDEAQIPFNARDWAKQDESGERRTFNYMAQHRKKADDVWAYTQAPTNLDQQFRSVAQDFRKCKNERLVQLGAFRGRDRFTVRHFEQEPSRSSVPYKTEHYDLDPQGVASCYDTRKGIGVSGRKADLGARAKGISVWWGVSGFVALVAGIYLVPNLVARAASRKKEPPRREEAAPVAGAKQAAESTITHRKSPDTPISPANQSSQSFSVLADRPVVEGKLIRGDGRARLVLSDGRVLEDFEGEIEEIRQHRVKVTGGWIYMKRPVPRQLQPQVVNAPESPSVSESSPALPPPPSEGESAWQRHSDGVDRLKQPVTLSTGLSL